MGHNMIQKYHKAYYVSLCQISVGLYQNNTSVENDDFLKYWVGVLLARFSPFQTTLKKVTPV